MESEVSIQSKKVEIIFNPAKGDQNSFENDSGKSTLAGVKKIVAIASGKGGVGKSTLTANLATALSRVKQDDGNSVSVGIMDCDLYGPSIPLQLGISERPSSIEKTFYLQLKIMGLRLCPWVYWLMKILQ